MKIEFDEVCKSCKGTGLYVGMAERDGAAVVCHTCDGSGCHHFKYEYDEFKKRRDPPNGVVRVFRANPGICIGSGGGYRLEDFGGIPVAEWKKKGKFPTGSENRRHTCPAWFYQTADYSKKPDWKACYSALGGTFSSCDCFKNKEACWARWDKEFGGK